LGGKIDLCILLALTLQEDLANTAGVLSLKEQHICQQPYETCESPHKRRKPGNEYLLFCFYSYQRVYNCICPSALSAVRLVLCVLSVMTTLYSSVNCITIIAIVYASDLPSQWGFFTSKSIHDIIFGTSQILYSLNA